MGYSHSLCVDSPLTAWTPPLGHTEKDSGFFRRGKVLGGPPATHKPQEFLLRWPHMGSSWFSGLRKSNGAATFPPLRCERSCRGQEPLGSTLQSFLQGLGNVGNWQLEAPPERELNSRHGLTPLFMASSFATPLWAIPHSSHPQSLLLLWIGNDVLAILAVLFAQNSFLSFSSI